jgi:hypothetical protein
MSKAPAILAGTSIRHTQLLVLSMLVAQTFSLCACGQGAAFVGGPGTQRAVYAHYTALTVVNHTGGQWVGPLVTRVGIGLEVVPQYGDPQSLSGLLRKVEIDWGEGSGYQDVTPEAFARWGVGQSFFEADETIPHEYVSSGVFAVIARVTFFDGETEVIEGNDGLTVRIEGT